MIGDVSSLIDDSDATRRRRDRPEIMVEPDEAGANGAIDPRDEEIRDLRRRLDDVSQQLLVARDAAVGADAERAVARARASELEHFLHVRTVEVEELTEQLRAITGADDGDDGGAPTAVAARDVVRRARQRLSDR